MNPNDSKKALTAEDVIRMYNLNNLKTDRKIITTMRNTLNRQHTIIKEYISNLTPYKNQANILTAWFYNGFPTLDNFPFNTFSEEEKSLHIGDLYYDRESGEMYQLKKDEEYKWYILDDFSALKSLALANSEADTSDNKRNIFYEEPFTPYDIGDIWLDGNYIMRCRCARSEGEYNNADWVVQEDYSSDLVLGETRAVLDEFKITIEKDYVTKVQLETSKDSILASVEAVTTEIVTTATQKYEFYDTELSQLKIDVGAITSEVSEVKTSFGEEITNLSSTIEQTAKSISSKVSQDDFGSYMQQYYDKFLIGFNNASNYIQIDTSGINIYDGSISSSYLLMQLNQDGEQFYREGYHVGNIITSQYSGDRTQKGLSFQLDSGGTYMGWFQRSSSGGNYSGMLYYSRANSFGQTNEGIHLGTNLYGHGWRMSGFSSTASYANDYEVVNNKSVPIVTDIEVDENGSLNITKSSIIVRDGRITAAPENANNI